MAVLNIDGKYRMFDPFMGVFFKDQDGNIATLKDIQIGQGEFKSEQIEALKWIGSENLSKANGFDRLEFYFKLYEPTYPWTVIPLNWSGFSRKLISKTIDSYYQLLGDKFLVFFQDFYFKTEGADPFIKARLKHLSFRYESAIKDYNSIQKDNDTVRGSELLLIDYSEITNEILASEIMFFKGQAFWEMKNYAKSVETFLSIVKTYPDTRWLGLIYFYLGDSYENPNETNKAINSYKRITSDIVVNFSGEKLDHLQNYIELTPAAIHLKHLT